MRRPWTGVIVALVTPLTDAGEICAPDIARLVTSVRPHVNALVPALSTGEGWALSDRQWNQLVAGTARHAGGLPVLAGIERPTTTEVIARARLAAALGARAVVVTTPYGPQVSQREMYRHYAAVTQAVSLPVVAYHESAVSGNSLHLDTLLQVCRLAGVVAVKDSGGSAAFTRRLIAARPGVPILQGVEALLLEAGEVDGYLVALANVEPALCTALFVEPSSARAAEVRAACERYGLARPDWYRMIKAELHRRGVLTTARIIQTQERQHEDHDDGQFPQTPVHPQPLAAQRRPLHADRADRTGLDHAEGRRPHCAYAAGRLAYAVGGGTRGTTGR
ncbi:MAG: dihydrodipicolinate synthase family protein [Pseudonocardiales bacterium]|nr:dihydrodipicolinate synthase family protein [Pseudonocardiales bacterium]MBV9030803.1 dihydrodipicolinate synthase family protein [Pseudonocardiales bacterium]MBW0011533.1 dihydrodipicolinate synthase family protein [Pseudonocardiales bacterium]